MDVTVVIANPGGVISVWADSQAAQDYIDTIEYDGVTCEVIEDVVVQALEESRV